MSPDSSNKVTPKKSLGQNFLTDKNISAKIVSLSDIRPGDRVVEVGPGMGALTSFIGEQTDNFVLVEIDKRNVEYLCDTVGVDRAKIIEADFLETDLAALASGTTKITGNLPYYITSPVLFKVYENSRLFYSAVFMIQKEVAQRLRAKPDTKEFGILTVATELVGTVTDWFDVPPSCFYPRPKVTSTVFRVAFHKERIGYERFTSIMRVVKACFNQRRKKLSNPLRNFLNVKFEPFRAAASGNPAILKYLDMRAEDLSTADYIILHDFIDEIGR